jgi:predicted metal-dependent enzyme (double-stranded beta helix superfamily)
MNPNDAMRQHIDQTLRGLGSAPAPGPAFQGYLRMAASQLLQLACSSGWPAPTCRAANAGEELLYPLSVGEHDGLSLYLVSDGVGVVSPPHEHCTWAVIAGIQGRELSHLYRRQSSATRSVVRTGSSEVGTGEVLVLDESAIHSTESIGPVATFHLHLYGRPLHQLPTFEARCFLRAGDFPIDAADQTAKNLESPTPSLHVARRCQP